MSIRTSPKRILFNTLTPATVVVAAGVVSIQGLPPFLAANVVAGNCYRACPAACTPQAVTITPTVPSATCACPWMWQMTVRKLPCYRTYRVQETFDTIAEYNYVDPNGATPTVAAIVDSIVLQINNDPSAVVTAVNNGSATFTLTEKDCDSENATCGFEAFFQSGTASAVTAHGDAVLTASELGREFAILPGAFLTRPELTYCGSYCKYAFRIKPITEVNDPHLSNAVTERYLDVEIYVNSSLANFAADWETEIDAAIACLAAP